MKGNKAQITAYIIFALVMAILIGVIYYMMFYSKSAPLSDNLISQDQPSDISAVKNYVQACIDEVSVPGIYLLASKGGYIYSYDNILNAENMQVAYHLELGNDVSPVKEFMEQELAEFIKASLPLCIDSNSFPDYELEFGEIQPKINIASDDVSVEVEYPLTIKKANYKATLSKFESNYPIRLGHILNIKNDILSGIKDNNTIDLTYLGSLDVEVTLLPYDKQNIVYSIYDEDSTIDSAYFMFNFAVKVEGNSAPILEFIPDFVLAKGNHFDYNAKASDPDNNNLSYYSGNEMINIDVNTGVISFFPDTVGDYSSNICVKDTYLAEDCMNVKFMVKDE